MENQTRFQNGIRWGIIGVGDVCEVKSAPAMKLIPNSQIIAVMRRNAEKAADYAHRHGIPKWYSDADALINDPEVNAIYIATPPDTHEFYTLKSAAAHKPVYVEKPMARTHQECLNMISACEKANVPLFVAYYRRELEIYKTVKRLITTDQAIGDIRFVDIKIHKPFKPDINTPGKEVNWRVEPEVSGGGYFYDLGSHQLDIMDYLFGPIQSAQGFAVNQTKQYPAEDIVLGTFSFKNGILGQGSWCYTTALGSEVELTKIYGSKGQLSFTFFCDFRIELEIDGKSKEIFTFERPKHIQQPFIQTIVDELMGIGHCDSTGISGARTNWVMQQICNRIDTKI